MVLNGPGISSHAKQLLGQGAVSSLPTGFLLIQLVFTVLLGSKGLHISTTLSWTKDVHSRNLVFQRWMTSCAATGRPYCAKHPPACCALSGLQWRAQMIHSASTDQLQFIFTIYFSNLYNISKGYMSMAWCFTLRADAIYHFFLNPHNFKRIHNYNLESNCSNVIY